MVKVWFEGQLAIAEEVVKRKCGLKGAKRRKEGRRKEGIRRRRRRRGKKEKKEDTKHVLTLVIALLFNLQIDTA